MIGGNVLSPGQAAQIRAQIGDIRAATDKPFGVNLITMHPQLNELIEVCGRHGVGHVVLAGGLPPGGAIDAGAWVKQRPINPLSAKRAA